MQENKGKQKKLLLIDSHALIHRTYHALPALTGPNGAPTSAIYGFTSILIKALRELAPDYILAAFDLPEPTFRHLEFEEYKAQRPKTPEDLVSQFEGVKEILKAFGIPVYEKSGYEADDVIGTIITKLKTQNSKLKSIILTGDLDTLQLVDENTLVYTLKKGITDTVIYDEKAVLERYQGLKPKQLADFKGLKGDSSDNIPGVPGIGEKTAISLLKEFGSIENLYEKLEKDHKVLKESLAKKLLENKDSAFFSKKLAEIKRDVDIDFDLENCELKELNIEKIKGAFKKYGFMSLIPRIKEITNRKTKEHKDAKTEEQKEIKIIEIKDKKDLAEFLSLVKKEKKLAFNIVYGEELKIYLMTSDDYRSSDVVIFGEKNFADLKPIFEDKNILKIGFDLKKQIKTLADYNIEFLAPYFDLMIAAYLLDPGKKSYDLKGLFLKYVGEFKEFISEGEFLTGVVDLWPIISEKIREVSLKKVLNEIEFPLIPVLAEMEKNGIKLDVEGIESLLEKVSQKMDLLEEEIYKTAGEKFNINSPQQLSEILFEKLKVSVKKLRKTPKGVISTQASELIKLKGQHKIIDLILDWRELFKIKSTYLDIFPKLVDKSGRIHTTFNQTGTATGRLSSLEPNLQNIPIRTELGKEIRKAFVAEKGYKLVSFDYSQIELRIVASIAQDIKMLEFFKQGKDIHTATAAEINNIKESEVTSELRRQAKMLNFGILYGMSSQSFAESAGIDLEKAKKFYQEYFSDFKGIKNYIENTKIKARRDGYVQTLTGRKRFLPEINAQNWQIRQTAERMAINMPIQGLAADIIKMAMVKIYEEIKKSAFSAKMLLQIHDELLFEIPEKEIKKSIEAIKKIMGAAFKLKIPLEVNVGIGDNWARSV